MPAVRGTIKEDEMMDITKEYIKMCEKAKEIQDTWRPQRGDIVGRQVIHTFVGDELKSMGDFSYDCIIITVYGDCPADSLTDRVDEKINYKPILAYYTRNPMGWSSLAKISLDPINGMFFYEFYKEELRWLPRQDQLQGMIDGQFYEKFYGLYHWMQTPKTAGSQENYVDDFTSMVQLWLAFVMEDKYNKTWNGKDWVK